MDPGWRVALAMVAVVVVIAAVWWVSVKTASNYEQRTSTSEPELKDSWPLTERGFWRGEALINRQRPLHAAAACASVALIAAPPVGDNAAARDTVIGLAVAALVAAVATVMLNLADATRSRAAKRPGPGDLLAESALSGYGQINAERDQARFRQRLREFGIHSRHWTTSPTRPVTGWDSLTGTEQAVAGLVAQGLSNNRIAS